MATVTKRPERQADGRFAPGNPMTERSSRQPHDQRDTEDAAAAKWRTPRASLLRAAARGRKGPQRPQDAPFSRLSGGVVPASGQGVRCMRSTGQRRAFWW